MAKSSKVLPNNAELLKIATLRSNSAAAQEAINDTIDRSVAAIKASGDKEDIAKKAVEDAIEATWSLRETTMVELAKASAAGDWTSDQIATGIKHALIASYGKEKAEEKVGTVARLRSELTSVMIPEHRNDVAAVFKLAATAYDAEAAAAKKAEKAGKVAETPLKSAYKRRYHMMVTRVRYLSPKFEGSGAKRKLERAASNPKTVAALVAEAKAELAKKTPTASAANFSELEAIIKKLSDFAEKVKKPERFGQILRSLRSITAANLVPSAPDKAPSVPAIVGTPEPEPENEPENEPVDAPAQLDAALMADILALVAKHNAK